MLNGLLSWFHFDVGEAAFYAVFGFIFVFIGIALLVIVFTLLGLVMKKANGRKPKQKNRTKKTGVKAEAEAEDTGKTSALEEIPSETIAVISAAIAAYYEGENIPCDFIVRRIKKL